MPRLKLRPFQAKDVAFIRENDYRVLVANAPGTGKTIECLACLNQDRKKLTPTVVVCPPSVAHNWRRETKKWCPWAKVFVLRGQKTRLPRAHIDVIIVPWSMLTDRYREVLRRKPRMLIVDEAHYAKNQDAQRSQALAHLARRVPHMLLLTGTPLINNEGELYALKGLFRGGDPPVVRRLLEDAAPDIPPKTRSVIPIDLRPKDRATYRRIEQDFETWLQEEMRRRMKAGEAAAAAHRAMAAEALVKVGYLRRVLARSKVYAAAEWISRAVITGEPVVVFLEHQEPLKRLKYLLKKQRIRFSVVEGSTGSKARQKAVDDFQTGKVPVFIGTKAAKEGITLHRARHLLFLERYFTSADEEQAEDRIRRIGQRYPTTIWFLHAVETLDDRLSQIIEIKRKLIAKVIGAADVGETDETATVDLLQSWGRHIDKKYSASELGLSSTLPQLPDPHSVISLSFGTRRWNKRSARVWSAMNGYSPAKKTRAMGKLIKIELRHPTEFHRGTFKAWKLSQDIQIITGRRRRVR